MPTKRKKKSTKKINKLNVRAIVISIVIIAIAIVAKDYVFVLKDPGNKPSLSLEELEAKMAMKGDADHSVPVFTEIPVDFAHEHKKDAVPFTGSALIDIDGDGVDEVYVGGGDGQGDALLKYQNNEFVNIIEETGLSGPEQDFQSISLDMDSDGDADLLVARASGVYLHTNNDGVFEKERLDIEFEECAEPFGLGAGDINQDGAVDLYIATFKCPEEFLLATYNNPANRSKNVMALNNGDNTFTDITESSGLAYDQNTFVPTFVDLDGDGNQDLVLATNTDTVRMYKNNGDETFTELSSPTDHGFWMGMSTGDIDNDGDQDFFMSNTGTTMPKSALQGDLTEDQELDTNWALLRNDGNFNFTQVNEMAGLVGYGFAWGSVFTDLNNDGLSDLIVAQNYIKWAAHKLNKLPGRTLIQGTSGEFFAAEEVSNTKNEQFEMTPLISDFNNDGQADIVFTNIAGPIRALISGGTKNSYLTVALPDDVSSIGATVTVNTDAGSLSRTHIVNQGLLSDQSNTIIFGLGAATEVNSVDVSWPNGDSDTLEDVSINSKVNL